MHTKRRNEIDVEAFDWYGRLYQLWARGPYIDLNDPMFIRIENMRLSNARPDEVLKMIHSGEIK